MRRETARSLCLVHYRHWRLSGPDVSRNRGIFGDGSVLELMLVGGKGFPTSKFI